MSHLSYKAKVAPTVTLALTALAVAVALQALTGRDAQAADPIADPTAAAREHYQKGTSYYDLGRYPEAIREFEAAYEQKNDPALLYNLAQSHRLAGNSEQALHFYRTYLRRVPKAANRAEIEGRIAALEQLVAQKSATQTTPPNQTIPPPGNSPPSANEPAPGAGAAGGAGAGSTPPPTSPPPSATPPSAAPPPATSWPSQPAPPPPDPGKRFRTIGTWVAIGGGALLLIGMIEGARAVGAANEINDAAKRGAAFDPKVEARGQSAERAEASLLVLGTLAAAAGGGLYYYGLRKTRQEAASHPGTISMAPVLSPGSAGALLRVTF